MRVAVIGAGVAGLVCAYRAHPGGPRGRRLRALAGPRRPGGDDRRRRRRTCSSATTTTSSPATATSPTLYDELGDARRARVAAVERWRFFVEGRSWPFTTPAATCCASARSRRRRASAWASRCSAAARARTTVGPYEPIDRARLDRAARWASSRGEKVWGPLLRGKFGDRADDISMAWLWASSRCAASSRARRRARSCSATRGGSWEPLFDALRDAIEARRRARADRPPGGADRPRSDGVRGHAPARPARSARGHDPRAFEPAGDRALRRGASPPCRTTSSSACSTTDRCADRATTSSGCAAIEYHTALCLLLELDRRFTPFYWTNVADPELPFVGLIEQTNFVEPERYDGRRFLYVANYLAPGDPLLALDAGGADRALRRPGCARSTRRSTASGSSSAGCTASRPPSRSSPSATASGSRRCRPASRAWCSPTRRRSIPRTAARTTPCGSAARPRRPCSRGA